MSPLFQLGAVERELKAIESEFAQARQSDESRLDELLCRAAPPHHPYARFTWGNRASLVDEPAAAGVDVHAAVRATAGLSFSLPPLSNLLNQERRTPTPSMSPVSNCVCTSGHTPNALPLIIIF